MRGDMQGSVGRGVRGGRNDGARRILEDLRRARVLVAHPPDEDGALLANHLRRLGCDVREAWPVPAPLPDDVDAVFLAIEDRLPEALALSVGLEDGGPAIIAVVTYETPTALKAIVDLNVHGVISKPLRTAGVLTQFALARHRRGYETRLSAKVRKLEETLKGRRVVERAVKLLVEHQGLDEDAAYRLIRDQASAERAALSSVAEHVIQAHETMQKLGLRMAPPQGGSGA